MGKWTSRHYDDVLGSKIKSLVSGSVRRAKLEDRPDITISYEALVEELDAGDSFTTSLVDVLVQELATRRMRSSVEDKRLISDNTSRSLRRLASSSDIYRPRRVGPPPSTITTQQPTFVNEHLALFSDDMGMEDDESGNDSQLDAAVEGARINSNLWEAISATSVPGPTSSATRRSRPVPRERGEQVYPSSSNSNPRQQIRAMFQNSSTTRASQDRIPSSRSYLAHHAARRRALTREGSESTGQGDNRNESSSTTLSTSRRALPARRYEGWGSDVASGWGPQDSLSGWITWERDTQPEVLILDDTATPSETTLVAESGLSTEQPASRSRRGSEGTRLAEAVLPWHSTFQADETGNSTRRHLSRTAIADYASENNDRGSWGLAEESW